MPPLKSLMRLWERVQVELHGQYSVTRFEVLVQYQARHTSRLRALAIPILGPLPLLLLTISVDALPLVPASEGYFKQTSAFWVRVFLVGWFTTFTLIYQTCIVAPVLPMSTTRLCVITTISGLFTVAVRFALNLIFPFPIPFSIQFEAGPFILMLGTALWLSWKNTLRTNPLAQRSLKRYLKVLATQIIMLEVYISFNLAFNQLHGLHQTMLSCLLPLIKLFLKNCISRGTVHLGDLSPTVVVFFVDVFHALFVSFTMQQASANGANVVVIAVDVVQSCIAFIELSLVLSRVHELAAHNTTPSSPSSRPESRETGHRPMLSIIDYTEYIIHSATPVHNHPHAALPQRSRGSTVISAPQQQKASESSVHPAPLHPSVDGFQAMAPCIADLDYRQPSQRSRRHIECTKNVLKLLHMLEFYVLVEYVEAMLSVSYGTWSIQPSDFIN